VDTANSFKNELHNITNDNFNDFALKLFYFQSQNNEIYKTYLDNIDIDPLSIRSVEKIPFLPIEFFKKFKIKNGNWTPELIFESSGTSGMDNSKHFLKDSRFYKRNCEFIFRQYYGDVDDFVFLALLPSYLERENSSLIFMMDHFIQRSSFKYSGFYLYDMDDLYKQLKILRNKNIKAILFGVTFALLDFCENFSLEFDDLIIIETGGMKGRRKELTRSEVHERIKKSISVKMVHSEYGMTELLSQAYSKGEGKFTEPTTMKVIIREINDPFSYVPAEKNGGINAIDLANIDTCAFIETKDRGIKHEDGSFEVLGRLDNSDLRGCNLMIN